MDGFPDGDPSGGPFDDLEPDFRIPNHFLGLAAKCEQIPRAGPLELFNLRTATVWSRGYGKPPDGQEKRG